MKKLIFMVEIMLIHTLSYSNPIDTTTAKIVAHNFLKSRVNISLNEARIVHKRSTDRDLLYVVNFGQKAFVIVSADDRIIPILAYSYLNNFEVDAIPAPVDYFLEGYASEIDCLGSEARSVSENISNIWSTLLQNAINHTPLNSQTPLLMINGNEIVWGQGTNYDYNIQCPATGGNHPDGPNGHAVAGCNAVALAQVMRYHECPLRGNGSNYYTDLYNLGCDPDDPSYGSLGENFQNILFDFANMPHTLNGANNTQIQAIAQLISIAGLSLDSDYAYCGTSAYNYDVDNAIEDYFHYSTEAEYIRRILYSETAWNNIIRAELDSHRPVVYGGHQIIPVAGHSWVCDGYDDNYNGLGLHFHMNWGWDGLCNGWFTLNSLDPFCSSHSYNELQDAIIEIQKEPTIPTVSITAPASGTTVTGTISINATASDAAGIFKVTFYIDNTLLTSDTEYPYTAQWNSTTVANGSHNIRAVAFDNANNSEDVIISVIVNNTAPSVPFLTLTNTGNIPNPVSYTGGSYSIAVTNSGIGTLVWSSQDVPSWVILNPTGSSTTSSTPVNVVISGNSGTSPRNCSIKFYNVNNAANYAFLYINQNGTPPASADWESFHKDMYNSGCQPGNINTAVGIEWQNASGFNVDNQGGPLIAGNKIILSSSGGVKCYDLAGNVLWTNTTVSSSTYPASYNGVLFVGDASDNKVYALSMSNGNIIDDYPVMANPEGVIKADASGVYIPTDLNKFYCLTYSSNNLSLKWVFDANSTYGVNCEFRGSGAVVYGDYVFVNCINATDTRYYFIKLSKSTGSKLYDYYVNGTSMSYCNTPVLHNSRIFVTYKNNGVANINSIDPINMGSYWYNADFNHYNICTPVGYNGKIYVGDDNGYVYCINSGNPFVKDFEIDYGTDVEGLAVVNNALVVLNESELNIVNLTNGSVITTVDISSDSYTPAAITGNKIIFANNGDDEIFCCSNFYPPTADFDATPTTGTAPLSVAFDDDSTPGSGGITGYNWDFGDGTTSTSSSPSHTYLTPGVYTVSLTVTSPSGSNTKTRTNYISVQSAPQVIIVPEMINYGNCLVGNCSNTETLIVTNTGGGTATGTITLSNSTDFQIVTGGGSFSIPGGQAQTVTVRFCPTSPGNKVCTILVDGTTPCNDTQSSLQGFAITPFVLVTSPSGGEIWQPSSEDTIRWQSNIIENVRIELYKGGSLNCVISNSTENDGEYIWIVPTNQVLGNDYKIKIISTIASTLYDLSDENFTIGYPSPSLVVQPLSLSFENTMVGQNSPPQYYLISGSYLTSNVTITAPTGFLISLNEGTGFQGSLILTPTGGSLSTTTVFVIFTPLNAIYYSGMITNITSGVTTINVSVSGNGTAIPIPSLTVVPGSLQFGEIMINTSSSAQSYQLSGINLVSSVTITAPVGFEVSLNSNSGFSGVASVEPVSGTITNIPIFVRFSPLLAQVYNENVTNVSSGAATLNVSVSGTGVQPVLSVIPPSQVVGPNAGQTSFNVSNSGTGNMTYSAVITTGDNWFTILSGATGGNSGTIVVSYPENNTGSQIDGSITVTAAGATGSPTIVTITQTTQTAPVLSITPSSYNLTYPETSVNFNITNTGGGSMTYSSEITQGVSWLTITSGATGGNSGTITVLVDENQTDSERTGIITVTAPDAQGSPSQVSIIQQGTDLWEITVTNPKNNDIWQAGYLDTIRWHDNITENVRIDLYKDLSFDREIVSSTISDGSFLWSISTDLKGFNYKIKVTSVDYDDHYDYSDPFTIENSINTKFIDGRSAFSLMIYPNPALDKVFIKYILSDRSKISLTLTDIFGRNVMTIFEGDSDPGESLKEANLDKLAPGLYCIKITDGTSIKLKKLVIFNSLEK